MNKISKYAKQKTVIGAMVGTLITGGVGLPLINIFKTDKETLTYPIVRDNINTYGVTSKKQFIKDFTDEEFGIDFIVSKKDYTDLHDSLKNNCIELNLYQKNSDIKNYKDYLVSDNNNLKKIYSCSFPIDELTEQEIEDIIELFKNGQIKQILNSIPSYEIEESEYNIPIAEMNNSSYSAELLIKKINYKDVNVTKQSQEYNRIETIAYLVFVLLGIKSGALIGSYSENKHKIKKLTK